MHTKNLKVSKSVSISRFVHYNQKTVAIIRKRFERAPLVFNIFLSIFGFFWYFLVLQLHIGNKGLS